MQNDISRAFDEDQSKYEQRGKRTPDDFVMDKTKIVSFTYTFKNIILQSRGKLFVYYDLFYVQTFGNFVFTLRCVFVLYCEIQQYQVKYCYKYKIIDSVLCELWQVIFISIFISIRYCILLLVCQLRCSEYSFALCLIGYFIFIPYVFFIHCKRTRKYQYRFFLNLDSYFYHMNSYA